LNETAYGDGLVARGKHWLIFGKKTRTNPSLQGQERLLQNRVLMSNWLFFDAISSQTYDAWKNYTTSHSAIGAELPPQVYLMTFESWDKDSFLIRLEHILEKGEDPSLSGPVTVNLTQIFPGNYIFRETSLAANQWIEDVDRLQFQQEGANILQAENKLQTPKIESSEDFRFKK